MAMTGAGDRHDVGSPRQDPGKRQLRRRAVLGCSEILQLFQQLEVAAQIIALKPRHIAACVARSQFRDVAERAGQETPAERAVDDKPDTELFTERQDLSLDVTGPQRVLDLHSADRVSGVGPSDRCRAGFANAEMPYLALAPEVAHRSYRFLDRNGRIDAMDVVKVDHIGFEALEAALAALLDVCRPSIRCR